VTIREAAERWARTWERAWNERDVEAVVALYAEDAVFSSEPFRVPYQGRDGVRAYVVQAFAEESAVSARFAPPIVGEDVAAVSWWATLVENGDEITLAGTSTLAFNADSLVRAQWDAWNQAPGTLDPPPWPFRSG
jgi:uncharacterized protein (TIGR02246 family)